MKILIQNYASPISSEPLYFNQAFQMTEGIESMLWSPNTISTYDVFDKYQPDIFICHHLGISNEIISYLSGTPIQIVVNITNITEDNLTILEDMLAGNNITCRLMFSNNYDFVAQPKPKNIKYEKILPCADVFFLESQIPDYKLDAMMVSSAHNDRMEQLEGKFESYHKMKVGVEQDENFDMNVNVIMLSSLYSRYKEVVICDAIDIAFSQVFFDAFLKSEKVSIKLPKNQEHLFTTALSEIFKEEGDENLVENIRGQIKENHTCINRVKQLMGAIG